jgi:two-component sensor histidine kinase
MLAAGVAWFAGTLGWPSVGLHRAFLVLLVLTYPSGRLPRSRLVSAAIAAAILYSTVPPLLHDDAVTVVIAVLVAVAAARVFRDSGGIGRRAVVPALFAAVSFAGVLFLGAGLRMAGVASDRPVLWTYDLLVAGIATMLFVDLLRARWSEAVLRGLVVDLGDLRNSTSLQRRLARALGDPTLVVGVWDGSRSVYVDESGAPVEFPADGQGRRATRIDDDGAPFALVTYDEAVVGVSQLLPAVTAVTRTAVANASLAAGIEERVREIAASRRRLVEAADDERRALQRTLAHGPERRLRHVSALLAQTGTGSCDGLRREVAAAIAELRELANGVHPPELEGGLLVALPALAARSTLQVSVAVDVERLPETVEIAAYFVCSEALANAAKHARTESARVDATADAGSLQIRISDDGVGGANTNGTGLRGLADRIEALSGKLTVTSPPGAGTQVLAEIPCSSR